MLLELLRAGNVDSSGSSGVGRGEGKWMLVRSGREPPVLCVAGIRAVVFSWSADGKMLNLGKKNPHNLIGISAWTELLKMYLTRKFHKEGIFDGFCISDPHRGLCFASRAFPENSRARGYSRIFNTQHFFFKISTFLK